VLARERGGFQQKSGVQFGGRRVFLPGHGARFLTLAARQPKNPGFNDEIAGVAACGICPAVWRQLHCPMV